MSPNRPADPHYAKGRRAKALQFLRAADEIIDLAEDAAEIADAYVTLCVHAGIAAADALTAHRLAQHHAGENQIAWVRVLLVGLGITTVRAVIGDEPPQAFAWGGLSIVVGAATNWFVNRRETA